MGRTKKQKAAAAKDEPGPDDYIFLAVFFPVGRSGAALARDDDPKDIQAAQRIGRWMHEAGLPIRKLFARKSEQHIIVEVRKEISEETINSKLGGYKWVDTIVDTSKIPPDFRDCETTILRARVRSHDAIDKMGGMVYFPIEPIIPTGPRSESQFKYPFPKPKRIGYSVPSTSGMIRYHPLPPEFTVIEDDGTQPDVKPDIKPDVTPSVNVDIQPDPSRETTHVSESTQPETTPKPEADVKPKVEELPPLPNVDMNPVKEEKPEFKIEPIVRPNWDMNPSTEERLAQEETKPKVEEIVRPNWEMNPSTEERQEQERLAAKHEEQRGFKSEEQGASAIDQQEQLREPAPSSEQGKTSAEPAHQNREPENSPSVKTEPQQPPTIQKRPAEDGSAQGREVKRERLA